MEVTESPSMEEVRKFLKDADSYDPTLTNQEMLEIYQALQDSHKTASEEELRRHSSVVCNDADMTLEELHLNSEPVVRNGLEHNNKLSSELSQSTSSTTSVSANDAVLTRRGRSKNVQPISLSLVNVSEDNVTSNTASQDLAEELEQEVDIDIFHSSASTYKSLEVINHSFQYEPPIYCNPKLAHLDVIEKACLISHFHMTLLEKYRKYQRKSRFIAQWGKPIQATVNFKGHLEKKITTYDETDIFEDENKCDTEERTELYTSKSGRVTKRKLYIEQEVDCEGWIKKSKPSPNPETSKKIQQKKRPEQPLNNEEVIKKSKIFSDHNRNISTGVGTRAEKMFDTLFKEEEKKQEAEKEIARFNETIEHLSDDDFIDVEKEEPYVRRRVVPPSYAKGRATGRSRGRGKKNTDLSNTQQKYDSLKSGKELSTGFCPVCNEKFFEMELFDHVNKCLGNPDPTEEEKNAKSTTEAESERMTCEGCDEVFYFEAQYKEHIQHCQYKNKK